MALIEPNSTVVLFKGIPFDPSYRDTMYFASNTAQADWFAALPAARKRTYTAVSYQRRTSNTIRLEEVYANVYNVNYMAFKNTSFENKWFYAFVLNIEYVNNITVEITYQLDVIQSWLFSYGDTNMSNFFSECTIERCHTTTDVAGEHTLPESMPLGEYVADTTQTAHGNHDSYYSQPAIIVASNVDYTDPDNFAPGRIVQGGFSSGIGNYYSGLYLLEVPVAPTQQWPDPIGDLNDWLELITEDGNISSIVSISMADGAFINTTGNPIVPKPLYINRPTSLVGSYQPRNKKLLTYPYTFAAVSDNMGHENKYPFELFDERTALDPYHGYVVFNIWGNNNLNSTIMIWPEHYKGVTSNMDEVMESMSFPQCAWNNDTYKAMLAQIMSTAPVQVANAMVSGGLAGGLAGALTSGVSAGLGVASNLAMLKADPANEIPALHGNSNATAAYQYHGIGFELRQKSIKPEYAAIIDSFFDMYGYRVEQKGIPNINARPYYTYIKTRDSSVGGLIPANDAREIEGIFDKGIRFWTTSAAFGEFNAYGKDNSPVTPSSNTPEVPTEPTEPTEPVTPDPDPEEEEES